MENSIDEKLQPELVVMLTHNDFSVDNAEEIFEQCRDSQARYWGMKEVPLPQERMKALFTEMKKAGKITVLEVVGYTEEEGVKGAELAAACGCDILMGTMFSRRVADICHANGIRYMPFVGTITGRPSVLTGDIEEIVAEAQRVVAAGADGVDLLGYRYAGDAVALNRALCESLPGRVCIAGSIDSYQRLDEVKEAGAALFTIGGAFFENKFADTFAGQIDKVCNYLKND